MFNIESWANNAFEIKNGQIVLSNTDISLAKITKDLREIHSGPMLLKFPHLIKKQIDILFDSFNLAIKEFKYQGCFNSLFPLKTNQSYSFLKYFLKQADKSYGLEAGSKAELILAMAIAKENSTLVINGFKDEEIIKLAFSASNMGLKTTIIVEGLSELNFIVKYSKKYPDYIPNIGIRTKLHNFCDGPWSKSSGVNSKFGLTANEIVKSIKIIKENNLTKYFTMLHFHMGSQISDIRPYKKAIIEVGNIYAHLKNMGSDNLNTINIGGGLGINYSSSPNKKQVNYNVQEFANDVIFLLKESINNKNIKEPDILIESGRFISANHSVLVVPTIEIMSNEYNIKDLDLKNKKPKPIKELLYIYENINKNNAIEFLHDSFLHIESILNLFDLGYTDLNDRSNGEIILNLIIKKSIYLLDENSHKELLELQEKLQEKYLINFSLFQSIPDFWGLNQTFPILPLEHLNKKPTRNASLWDITCDSDGEIPFNTDNPLMLHDVNIDTNEYFLGIFLTGAYQESLSMHHNLFAKPTQAIISLKNNSYKIEEIISSHQNIEILNFMGYKNIQQDISNKLQNSKDKQLSDFTKNMLGQNSYLKTHLKEKNDD